LAGEYIAYMRDTGLADYRATPGNLGALIAVRDLDDERVEVITLSWWPSMDAIGDSRATTSTARSTTPRTTASC